MKTKHPNLLYIFPDQFRISAMNFWSEEAFNGHLQGRSDPVITPNLDNFAREATILPYAVSNCPVCSPHRGSLFTGCYPDRSGVPLNCNSIRPVSSLAENQTCLTDILSEQGYSIGYIGKWHLDLPTPNDPQRPGEYVDPNSPAWDSYTEPARRHGIDYWYAYGTFDQHKNPHYYDAQGKRHEPNYWSARHEADKAIEYLNNRNNERDDSKPFALFVSMNPPHSPYNSQNDCEESDLALYHHLSDKELLIRDNADHNLKKAESARYYFANVTGVDREFGRIIAELKHLGEWDNTTVIFTSDHGETLCSQGVSDAKNCIYSEAFNVPFLLKLPGQIHYKINNLLLSSPDIMPTLLGILGFSEQIPANIQGRNLNPLLDTEHAGSETEKPECALYLRNLDGEKRDGLIQSYFPESRGIKTRRYTLAVEIDRQQNLTQTLFFDDKNDPYQLNNLTFNTSGDEEQILLRQLARELKRIDDFWYQNRVLSELIPY